jgi:hypothetical protein
MYHFAKSCPCSQDSRFRDYAHASYEDIHICLVEELTIWYEKHPPAKPADSDKEPAVDAPVDYLLDVADLCGKNDFSVGRRRSAAIDAPAGAGGSAAAAAAPAVAASASAPAAGQQ